jgi:hypothetical protein
MPYHWEAIIKRQGKRRADFQILGHFGKLEIVPGYTWYCTPDDSPPGMVWREACEKGRTWGPVVPDSHPKRKYYEALFMEQPCPEWFAYDEKPSGYPPYTFDPWFVQHGENQNHWKNVEAGCGTWKEPHPSWKYWDTTKYVKSGMFWAFTIHGNLKVKACIGNGHHCVVSKFRIDF